MWPCTLSEGRDVPAAKMFGPEDAAALAVPRVPQYLRSMNAIIRLAFCRGRSVHDGTTLSVQLMGTTLASQNGRPQHAQLARVASGGDLQGAWSIRTAW